MTDAEDFLIRWNYQFPADRWWRKKYKIPLFSEKHLNASQLDIALEYIEEKMFMRFESEAKKIEKDDTKWIAKKEIELTSQEEEDLFDTLDPLKFN